MASRVQLKGWGEMADPPNLTSQQWNMTGLLGVILIVMAILQLIGFSDFKDWLDSVGLGAPTVWAIAIVVAEIWVGLTFFKLKLMNGFRVIGAWLAVLVSGFWFIETLRLVSEGAGGQLTNSGFFGKYLHQSPGWWTVLEASILLFWVAYSLRLLWPKNR
ncbi:MAG TPA: hypothetical protein VLE51_00240 [Candidatus Saccharimonadales bacterium]|nr:hypothetical protein [Candidatus Saccharimonadales bacterium]